MVTVGPSFFPNGCAKAPVLEIPLPRIPAPREPRFQQPLGHPDLELTDVGWDVMGMSGALVNHIFFGDCILTMVILHLNGMIFQVGIEKVSNPWDPASPNLGMVSWNLYKYLAFCFGDCTPPNHHPLTYGDWIPRVIGRPFFWGGMMVG